MSNKKPKKLISNLIIAIDIIFSFIFFFLIQYFLRDFVPIETEPANTIFSGIASIPIIGTSWIALQCFRVTWLDHQKK